MAGVDVAVEFSQPGAVLPNIEAAARTGVHVVVGTTGWADQRDKVEQIVIKSGIGLVYGANFSLGMNLFSGTRKRSLASEKKSVTSCFSRFFAAVYFPVAGG